MAHHRLFSGCRSGLMAVSDYHAGKVVATLPIGMGVDGAGYDPASGNAFASNADGSLTVIHQDSPNQYHVARKRIDADRVAQYGPRSGQPPGVPGFRQVREPPAGGKGRGRPPVLPGTFSLLVVESGSSAK